MSKYNSNEHPSREKLPLWIRRHDGDADQIHYVSRPDDRSSSLGIEDVLLLTTHSLYPTLTLTLATSRVSFKHYHYPSIVRKPTTNQSQLTSPSPPQLQQHIPTHPQPHPPSKLHLSRPTRHRSLSHTLLRRPHSNPRVQHPPISRTISHRASFHIL